MTHVMDAGTQPTGAPPGPATGRSTNEAVAARFLETARLLENQGANPFRVRAYRLAAETLRRLRRSVEHILGEEGPAGLGRLSGCGPGLAADDLARLGQRFFRVAGSEAPGSGLGWSIVQRIAQAHGARLEATRAPILGGLLARATFPSAGNAAMRK